MHIDIDIDESYDILQVNIFVSYNRGKEIKVQLLLF